MKTVPGETSAVIGENDNKQTNKQTDRQTDKQTFIGLWVVKQASFKAGAEKRGRELCMVKDWTHGELLLVESRS